MIQQYHMDPDAANLLRAHYLKVQALSPVVNSSTPPAGSSSPADPFFNFFTQNPTSAALLIFCAFMVIGIIGLLITKVRNVNTILTLMFIAFMTSTIPYGTRIIQQQTHLESQAGPELTPKNLIIDNVTRTGFTIMWDTDNPNLGALRLKSSLDPTEIPKIASEPDGPPLNKHVITVNNLKSNTLYYVDILSGSTWYNNNGRSLEVKTAP